MRALWWHTSKPSPNIAYSSASSCLAGVYSRVSWSTMVFLGLGIRPPLPRVPVPVPVPVPAALEIWDRLVDNPFRLLLPRILRQNPYVTPPRNLDESDSLEEESESRDESEVSPSSSSVMDVNLLRGATSSFLLRRANV